MVNANAKHGDVVTHIQAIVPRKQHFDVYHLELGNMSMKELAEIGVDKFVEKPVRVISDLQDIPARVNGDFQVFALYVNTNTENHIIDVDINEPNEYGECSYHGYSITKWLMMSSIHKHQMQFFHAGACLNIYNMCFSDDEFMENIEKYKFDFQKEKINNAQVSNHP